MDMFKKILLKQHYLLLAIAIGCFALAGISTVFAQEPDPEPASFFDRIEQIRQAAQTQQGWTQMGSAVGQAAGAIGQAAMNAPLRQAQINYYNRQAGIPQPLSEDDFGVQQKLPAIGFSGPVV